MVQKKWVLRILNEETGPGKSPDGFEDNPRGIEGEPG
jgi:hypothetical protein